MDLRLRSGLDLDSILGPFGDLLAALEVQWAPGERLEVSRGLLGGSWWPLGLAWEPLGARIVDLSSKPSFTLYPFATFSQNHRSLSIRLLCFLQIYAHSLSVCYAFSLQIRFSQNHRSLSSRLQMFTKTIVHSLSVCDGLSKPSFTL